MLRLNYTRSTGLGLGSKPMKRCWESRHGSRFGLVHAWLESISLAATTLGYSRGHTLGAWQSATGLEFDTDLRDLQNQKGLLLRQFPAPDKIPPAAWVFPPLLPIPRLWEGTTPLRTWLGFDWISRKFLLSAQFLGHKTRVLETRASRQSPLPPGLPVGSLILRWNFRRLSVPHRASCPQGPERHSESLTDSVDEFAAHAKELRHYVSDISILDTTVAAADTGYAVCRSHCVSHLVCCRAVPLTAIPASDFARFQLWS